MHFLGWSVSFLSMSLDLVLELFLTLSLAFRNSLAVGQPSKL